MQNLITTPADYWIAPNAVNIALNALGNANRIQCSVASGAVIMCFIDEIRAETDGGEPGNGDGLWYGANHEPRRWPLSISPTYFNSDTRKYVYAAIPRTTQVGTQALIVFPSELLDIYGRQAAVSDVSPSESSSSSSDDTPAQIGSTDFFYVFLGGIISAVETINSTEQRRWETPITDWGTLETPQGRDESFNKYTFWGQSVNANNQVTGPLAGSIDYIEFANGVRLGVDTADNTLKVYMPNNQQAHLFSTGAVSAFGPSALGGGGGDLIHGPLLSALNAEPMPTDDGYLHWTGSAFEWVEPGGGGEMPSTVAWNNITGKPSTFQPSAHTHLKEDITDFAHAHDDRYYTESEMDGFLAAKLGKPSQGSYTKLTVASGGGVTWGTLSASDIPSLTKSKISDFPTQWAWSAISGAPFTGDVANSAAKLSDTAAYTAWGQTFFTGGKPASVSGDLDNVANITMSGHISINSFIVEKTNDGLKHNGNVLATGAVSALGVSAQGNTTGALSLLTDVNISGTPTNGYVLTYDSTSGKWTPQATQATDLTAYATKEWVGQQGYVTSSGVTSVTAGTGLSGGTITASGTIAINSTYQTYISNGNTAYGWGNHANAGYATQTWVGQQGFLTSSAISDMATKTWVGQQGFLTGITSNMVTTALGFTPLSNATTFWGRTASNGVVSGSMTGVGSITMSGSLSINSFIVEKTNDGLKHNGNILATGAVSALGISAQGSNSGALSLLSDVYISGTPNDGYVLAYNAALGKWVPQADNGPAAGYETLTVKGGTTTVGTYSPAQALSLSILGGTGIGIVANAANKTITISNTYMHPSDGANETIAQADGRVLSSITVNVYGHVTAVGSKTLAAADIPSLTKSKISDFPTTWAWSAITGTPTTLGDYGITDAATAAQMTAATGRLSTLEGYFDGGVANSAKRLSGTASYTAWGQTYWQNGVPKGSFDGNLTIGTDKHISFKDSNGVARQALDYEGDELWLGWGTAKEVNSVTNVIGYGVNIIVPTENNFENVISVTTDRKVGIGTDTPSQELHVVGNIMATGAVSALGISAQGSNSGALSLLTDVNISGTPTDGYVLTYDSTSGKWTPQATQATDLSAYATRQWVEQNWWVKNAVVNPSAAPPAVNPGDPARSYMLVVTDVSQSSGTLQFTKDYIKDTFAKADIVDFDHTHHTWEIDGLSNYALSSEVSQLRSDIGSFVGSLSFSGDYMEVGTKDAREGYMGTVSALLVPFATTTMGFKRLSVTGSQIADANTMTVGGVEYALLANYASIDLWANMPSGMSWGNVLQLTSSSPLSGQLAWDSNHGVTTGVTRKLYWRSRNSTGWGTNGWHTIAYEDWVTTQLNNLGDSLQSYVTTQLGGYLPLTAGTSKPLTGSLYVTPEASTHQTVEIRGSQYYIGLAIGSGNVNRGLYGQTVGGGDKWLLYFNASNTILNYGNVGIGTTSPAYKLDVNGAIAGGNIYAGSYLFMNKNNAGIYLATDSLSWHDSSHTYTVSLLNFTSAGKVGVGVAPGAGTAHRFEVNGSAYFSGDTSGYGLILANDKAVSLKDSGGTIRRALFLNTNNQLAIGYGTTKGGAAANQYDTAIFGRFISFGTGSGNNTDPAIRMIIDNAGNVGIGTNNPQHKLHVAGNIVANGAVSALGVSAQGGSSLSLYETNTIKLFVDSKSEFADDIMLDGKLIFGTGTSDDCIYADSGHLYFKPAGGTAVQIA